MKTFTPSILATDCYASLEPLRVSREDEPHDFFLTVFAGLGPNTYILLWIKEGERKRSYWLRSADEAAALAVDNADKDVYFGVCPSGADLGPFKRCKATDVAGMVAFALDVDLASDDQAHAATNLPHTVDEVLALFWDRAPSLVVFSGHGVHVYWLLETPVMFATATERARAQAVAIAWQTEVQRRAAEHGWKVDSTADFARVLRVPGSTNTKNGGAVPVRILSKSERRFTLDEFAVFLDIEHARAQTATTRTDQPRTASPSPAAQPQVARELLISEALQRAPEMGRNNAGFWLATQCRDNGYAQSESLGIVLSYRICVSGSNLHGQPEPYTEAEVRASVAQAFSRSAREPWGSPSAPSRVGTGARCHEDLVQSYGATADTAAAEAESVDATRTTVDPASHGTVTTEEDRRKARLTLRRHLKLDVDRVVKHGTSGAFYVLHLRDGRTVDLGKAKHFMSPTALRIAVVDALNLQLPRFQSGAWRKCFDALLALVETKECLEPDAVTREWLYDYLHCHQMEVSKFTDLSDRDSWRETIGRRGLMAVRETRQGGRIIIRLNPFYDHVVCRYNARLSLIDLATQISKVGFRPLSTLNGAVIDGKRMRVDRVWVAPAESFPQEPIGQSDELGEPVEVRQSG